MKTITAQVHFDLRPLQAESHILAVKMGANDDVLLLCLPEEPDYQQMSNAGVFTSEHTDPLWHFRIVHVADGHQSTVELPPTDEYFYLVQSVSPHLYLTVRGRSAGDKDANAHFYNASGQPVGAFPVGDGVEDVQTDQNGNIWVSYFDEGVYGNSKLAHHGLVCFDQRGKPRFRYFDLVKKGLPEIDTCYALNVAGTDETWLCYRGGSPSGFPLVQLRSMRFQQMWPNVPVQGAHAFAISSGRALFAGCYGDRQSLFLLSLDGKPQEKLTAERWQLVDPNGQPLQFIRATGRGAHLYLQDETTVWTVNLERDL